MVLILFDVSTGIIRNYRDHSMSFRFFLSFYSGETKCVYFLTLRQCKAIRLLFSKMETTRRRGRPVGSKKKRDDSQSEDEYSEIRDKLNTIIDSKQQWLISTIRGLNARRAAIDDAISRGIFDEKQWNEEQEKICQLLGKDE